MIIAPNIEKRSRDLFLYMLFYERAEFRDAGETVPWGPWPNFSSPIPREKNWALRNTQGSRHYSPMSPKSNIFDSFFLFVDFFF